MIASQLYFFNRCISQSKIKNRTFNKSLSEIVGSATANALLHIIGQLNNKLCTRTHFAFTFNRTIKFLSDEIIDNMQA